MSTERTECGIPFGLYSSERKGIVAIVNKKNSGRLAFDKEKEALQFSFRFSFEEPFEINRYFTKEFEAPWEYLI